LPRSYITYSGLFGLLEAAHWRGIPWDEFCRLSVDEQARIVAHYRAHHQMRAVEEWEMHKAHARRK